MVYSNERAKSNQAHLRRWPVNTVPFDDELLSSWLIRVSFDHFTAPLILTSYLWGNWRAWTFDLDRELSVARLNKLSACSGISVSQLQRMSLRSTIEKISRTNLIEQSMWPWVVARHTRNRNTYRYQPFCPKCLKSDSEPYFRRTWRLSFVTVCTLHSCQLLDCCPHCKQSIEPHRLKTKTLTECMYCHQDITTAPSKKASSRLLKTTNELIQSIDAPNSNARDIFHQLEFWIAALRKLSISKSTTHKAIFSGLVDAKDRKLISSCRGVNFNFLTVESRSVILKYCNIANSDFLVQELARLSSQGLSSSFMTSLLTTPPLTVLNFLGLTWPRESNTKRACPQSPITIKKAPRPRPLVEKSWELLLRKHRLGKL